MSRKNKKIKGRQQKKCTKTTWTDLKLSLKTLLFHRNIQDGFV